MTAGSGAVIVYSTIELIDDFEDRTETNRWGNTSNGKFTWRTDVAGVNNQTDLDSAFSVHDGYGQVDPEATPHDDALIGFLGTVEPGVIEIRARFSIEDTTTEADYEQEPQFYVAQYDAGQVWNFHGVDVFVEKFIPDNPLDLANTGYFALTNVRGGNEPGDVTLLGTGGEYYTWGDIWNIHMRVEGGRVQATLWADGDSEPGDWMLQGGSTDYVFPSHGDVDTFYLFVPNVGQSVRLFEISFGGANPVIIGGR